MFREMRRKNQGLSEELCNEIIAKASHGVLSIMGDDGYPYGVPLSHVIVGNKIFFHGSPIGHKADAIGEGTKCSYTVVDADQVVQSEFTTYFRSVIAFGKVRRADSEEERLEGLKALGMRFSPDFVKECEEYISRTPAKGVATYVLDIEHMTGKEAKELMLGRKAMGK